MVKQSRSFERSLLAHHLRANHYRLTESRLAVLEALERTEGAALNVQQILERAQQRCATLGKATVYRTLECIEMLGVVRRVHDQNGCHRYVASSHQGQPLLVCTHCGCVQMAPPVLLEEVNRLLQETCGYLLEAAAFQFAVVCPNCR